MPIHDWTRVEAGVFHGFHLAWISEIRKAMNSGLLPTPYYADAEQYFEKREADILTLSASQEADETLFPPGPTDGRGILAVVSTTHTHRVAKRVPRPRPRQRRLIIRHISGHRVVAILEIVSPGNKDRRDHAIEFASKVQDAIAQGIHVMVIDLFPPTRATPRGLHGEIWRRFDRERIESPIGRPLVLSTFVAQTTPEIFLEFTARGEELPKIPLALTPSCLVALPLAETYAAAFEGSPPYLRELLSQPTPAPGA